MVLLQIAREAYDGVRERLRDRDKPVDSVKALILGAACAARDADLGPAELQALCVSACAEIERLAQACGQDTLPPTNP
jgi:hypothetical protein